MNYKFGKSYKLCSKILIEEVFNSGKSIKVYPLVAKYKLVELKQDTSFQLVISAPKRTFRFAHQRNRIKRICKEAIRLNKNILESPLRESNKQLALFLIYSGKEELPSRQLQKKTGKLFEKIIEELNENN
ncbi:MAG: ribonuclease P protein component [Crocinitomicaceae bacterium]|nr:ribonuclease P protein component [Crocinitomicaceae bacterium]